MLPLLNKTYSQLDKVARYFIHAVIAVKLDFDSREAAVDSDKYL